MSFKRNSISDIKEGSRWIRLSDKAEIEIKYTYQYSVLSYFYIDNPDKIYDSSLQSFLDYFKPKSEIKPDSETLFQVKSSGKVVGDLLNDDVVVVIHTEGVYKGGNTAKVKYELADFMDDEPPFIEILFINKDDDCVYFTENLSEPVYDLNGLLVVRGNRGEYHG